MTAVADRYGASRGGFVGGLPSTGPVGLLFIGLSQSTGAAVEATSIFPLGFAVTFCFLLFYSLPKRLGFASRMSLALVLWSALAAGVAASGLGNFELSLAGAAVVCAVAFTIARRANIKEASAAPSKLDIRETAIRVALGGSVVAGAVILTQFGGPLVGGVFSAAPAIWTSSLYIANRRHGVEFSRSLTSSFMRTSALTVVPYVVAVRYLYPVAGIWLGTLGAYAAVFPLVLIAWLLTSRVQAPQR